MINCKRTVPRLSVCLLAAAGLLVSSAALGQAGSPGCHTSGKKCFIDVLVSGTAPSYTVTFDPPDEVNVKQSERGKVYTIIFRLPNGFKFVPSQGDGVTFKDPDQDEFYDGHVSDNDTGTLSTQPKGWKRWVWKYRNTVDGRYRYKVVFRDIYGNTVVGDPVITNIDTH